MPVTCREKAISEAYVDFLWPTDLDSSQLRERFLDVCIQDINSYYQVFYGNAAFLYPFSVDYGYEIFPSLYTLLETESLEASQILTLQNQPVPGLKGNGVILGFIDTGIDYTNACFRDLSGKSRILEIWDQTINTGSPPIGISYGSVYTKEMLDEALKENDPFSLVPTRDDLGHGTRLAAIAGGSLENTNGWRGAAPLCDLAVVKLKPAKQYLRQYFCVGEEATAYQENDIMLGIRYLNELALRREQPLVICLGLGTNMGGHSGISPLSSYLNQLGSRRGRCMVIAGGNEANQGHHFLGELRNQPFQDAELRVAPGEGGILMELWSNTPDVLSISLLSPSGEEIPRITREQDGQRFDFLFENTVVYVQFQPLYAYSGEQLIVIRMYTPSPGIWRIRIFADQVLDGTYHIWLPVTGFVLPETAFLNSNPDTTLTEPANTEIPLTVGAYQTENNSIYIDSSRGFTRTGRIKPDITAPGVEVPSYGPQNRFLRSTGTSAATAITAGAAALLLEWGIVHKRRPNLDGLAVKQLLIRGAFRSSARSYPDQTWGYGILNLYQAFLQLGRF